jgi:hypothetical protein
MNEDLIFVKGYAERFLTKINTKYKSQIKKIIEGKKINKEEMLSDEDLKKYPVIGEVEIFVYKFVRDNQNLF